ncbi:ABC transporter permease [Cellvibrio sp. KY-YJ-3]|uniref:ABC transporter permease n=1 Tax=Cellvibrio sp. KY-YJ-3 TaxID=454662 RepID=UPI001244D18C|nr:ABC transporter permease [Cellvibrio sp. KY-YJ-3]QEY11312.1 ABC transporter permease [Cellvibrio sp. KY-YJ-3]
MNPNMESPTSIKSLIGSLISNRGLVSQIVRQQIVGKYRGSYIGILWPLLNPIFMLVVYTFVFSIVLKVRWSGDISESKLQFAFILFTGMLIHGLFAEVINKAPSLILLNANYVKKVIFPLEILALTNFLEGLFNFSVGMLVLLIGMIVFHDQITWTIIFLPIILIPYFMLLLGLIWFIASLGVFVRDIAQGINVLTTVLLFLSPIFYSKNALPPEFQWLMNINPLTFIIEQSRDVLIWGKLPNWQGLGVYSLLSGLTMWIGYYWFQKTRKGFADVI